MKSYNAFLVFVLVSVVQVGQAHSRATREVDPQCNHTAIPNTRFDLPFILLNSQYDCIKSSSSFLEGLNRASSRDDFHQIFQNACAQESSVRSCIAGVAAEARGCLNTMEVKMFATVQDYVESVASAVCRDGSEMVARMYADELKSLNAGGQLAVAVCLEYMDDRSGYDREPDQSAYTMRRYRAMKEGRSCVKEVADVAGGRSTTFQAFADPIIASMKCISPTTEEIVLCETLVSNSVTGQAVQNNGFLKFATILVILTSYML